MTKTKPRLTIEIEKEIRDNFRKKIFPITMKEKILCWIEQFLKDQIQ